MSEVPETIRCVICHKAKVPVVYEIGAYRATCPHCEAYYTVTLGDPFSAYVLHIKE